LGPQGGKAHLAQAFKRDAAKKRPAYFMPKFGDYFANLEHYIKSNKNLPYATPNEGGGF
jgi:hypothetical protein